MLSVDRPSTECRPITDRYIGQVSTNYRPSIGEVSAKCRRKVGEVSVNEKLYRPRHIWKDYRPCLDRVSTDYRPTIDRYIDRLSTDYRPSDDRVSTDCRPSVDRLSTECRPTIDRVSTAISTAISTDISVDITPVNKIQKTSPIWFPAKVGTSQDITISFYDKRVMKVKEIKDSFPDNSYNKTAAIS